RLTLGAINSVAPSSIQYKIFSFNDVQILLNKWQILFERQKLLDFDNSEALSDDEYKVFTSLSKIQFDELILKISDSSIRNSSNRSIRTAIAILLCKLRLGLSNNVLAFLFELPDNRAVARALESARVGLMAEFVSYNLGFNHVTRAEIINERTSTIAGQLIYNDGPEKAIVVVDETYIYIQTDVVVVDGGFRDSTNTMEALGLNVALPPFLQGHRQFTTTEAN
ncbi:unnamed protein product, partial [Rotaria sp. Silwood2]